MDTVPLASVQVDAYQRHSKSGHVTNVRSYTRDPGKMPLWGLGVELKSLTDFSPQARNRRVALHNEQRKRTQAMTPKELTGEIAGLKKRIAKVPENHPVKDALAKVKAELDHVEAQAVAAGDSGEHHAKTFGGMLERNAIWSAIVMAYVTLVAGLSELIVSATSGGAEPIWQFFTGG